MRPAAKMPKLTRRSRIWIAVAVAAVLLLLIGPRFVDTYVDWLWFGELGYRSVWTTQVVTRLVIFLVVTALVGLIILAVYGTRKAVPMKYLLPGLLLLLWLLGAALMQSAALASGAALAGGGFYALVTWMVAAGGDSYQGSGNYLGILGLLLALCLLGARPLAGEGAVEEPET